MNFSRKHFLELVGGCKPLSHFKPGTVVRVSDMMQKDYQYVLEHKPGTNFDPKFKPELTPQGLMCKRF